MQTMYKRLAGILVLAMGGQATVSANTEILYDTLSLSNPTERFVSIGQNQWAANRFSTGTDCPLGCTLGDITLSLQGVADLGIPTNSANFHMSIYSDSSGLPGNSLAGTINNPTDPLISAAAWKDYIFRPATSIALENNTSYWVRLDSEYNSLDSIAWERVGSPGNKIAYDGTFGLTVGNNETFFMKVEATPLLSAVPIPGAVWLMGSALVGLVVRGRRREAV